jgi:hypothetical protein
VTVEYSQAIRANRLAALNASLGAAARLVIYGGVRPAHPDVPITAQPNLGTMTGASTFGVVVGGVLTANPLSPATVPLGVSNIAPTFYRLYASDGSVVCDGDVGTDMLLGVASVTTGDTLAIVNGGFVVNTGISAAIPPAVLALTGSAGAGIANVPYTAQFTASGGVAPYAFSISTGTLPTGLTLNGGTGLISGTPTSAATFNFTVRVTDNVGSVATGTAQTVVIGASATVPGAPTSLVGTAGNAQISFAFVAPASTGGSTITGYTVTTTPGGFTATGASSPLVVTGLTNSTAYTATVHATNAVGNSAESAASSAVTPSGTTVLFDSNFDPQTTGAATTGITSSTGSTNVFSVGTSGPMLAGQSKNVRLTPQADKIGGAIAITGGTLTNAEFYLANSITRPSSTGAMWYSARLRTTDSTHGGYWAFVGYDGTLSMYKVGTDGTTYTALGTPQVIATPPAIGSTDIIGMRFQATGTTIRCRAWNITQGNSEGTTWAISVTDSTYSSGGASVLSGWDTVSCTIPMINKITVTGL